MWQCFEYDELGSTNDEAVRLSASGAGRCLAVTAKRQTAGRGRRGRNWQSLEGNLFLSLALPFDLKNCGALVLISGLALLQAVKELGPTADIVLKWPNDVLLNGAKISGILLEKGVGDYMIVGIGVNLKAAPESGTLYRVTSLQQAGIVTDRRVFMEKYLNCFDGLYALWAQKGTATVAALWQSYAKGIGDRICVRTAKEEKNGIFTGLDDQGMLILQTPAGREVIGAGDVFFEDERKREND